MASRQAGMKIYTCALEPNSNFEATQVKKSGIFIPPLTGVANGTSKNVGVGKFWQDLEISEAFLTSLEVSFLHGLFLLVLSLETLIFYQRVSGSDF